MEKVVTNEEQKQRREHKLALKKMRRLWHPAAKGFRMKKLKVSRGGDGDGDGDGDNDDENCGVLPLVTDLNFIDNQVYYTPCGVV